MRHSLTNNHEKIFKSFMIRRRILALQTDYKLSARIIDRSNVEVRFFFQNTLFPSI